jgi:hypothetical protein
MAKLVATPLWGKCEDETCTSKSENLKSSETPETSERDCKSQNTSHWGVIYTLERSWSVDVENGLAWTFRHLQHKLWLKEGSKVKLAVWLPTTKSWESTRPDVCGWSAKHCWKALEESYKFALDLIPIGGLSWELWAPKVPRVQIGIVSGLLLGTPGTQSHSDVGDMGKRRKYYMGEGGGFP